MMEEKAKGRGRPEESEEEKKGRNGGKVDVGGGCGRIKLKE